MQVNTKKPTKGGLSIPLRRLAGNPCYLRGATSEPKTRAICAVPLAMFPSYANYPLAADRQRTSRTSNKLIASQIN